ncbi:EthD domain-containing protein [Nocardia sp. CA-107356]|uniref:EthD domain-containing protein n=1 Tax=Nocardia sp. CA-107356 TaxID=3239972 RepID=UPI003D91522F
MIKVIWLLRRADHLTLDEFRDWWINNHAHLVASEQKSQLRGYSISVRSSDEDALAGRPNSDTDWDGIAEQWFDDGDAFNAVYGRPEAQVTRSDTDDHVSRLSRIIVTEHTYIPMSVTSASERVQS